MIKPSFHRAKHLKTAKYSLHDKNEPRKIAHSGTFKMGHTTLKEFTYKIIQNIFNKNCLNIVKHGYSPEIVNTCILQKKTWTASHSVLIT